MKPDPGATARASDPAALFVYGSLREGLVPRGLRALVAGLPRIAVGCVEGSLYDLGRYPGLVLEPGSGRVVQGEILALASDPDALAALDRYEGYDPSHPGASIFVRTRQRVQLGDGGERVCWLYRYDGPTGRASRVESGDWRRHLAARSGQGADEVADA